MAVCRITSLISSSVSPLVRAARRCIASSSWWPRATSAVSVISERLRRSRPGRVQISPQAYRVIRSWKSAVNAVVPAAARSTCASPSTSRRTAMPAATWSGRTMLAGSASATRPRLFRGRQVGDAVEHDQPAVADPARRSAARLAGGRRRVVGAGHGQHRRGDLVEPVAHVERGERLADQRVALARRRPAARPAAPRPRRARARAKPGANQRCGRARPSPSVPAARTVAARSRQPALSPIFAPVQSSAAAVDPVRGVEQQLQADRAADRVPGVGNARAGSTGRRAQHLAARSAMVNGSSGRACGRGRAGPSRPRGSGRRAPAAQRGPQRLGRGAERRAEHQQRPVRARSTRRVASSTGTVIARTLSRPGAPGCARAIAASMIASVAPR